MSTPDRALARARLGAADPTAARFTGSLAFDQRLWPHDIVGSVAWARALARAGLLTDAERDRIVAGLDTVRSELAGGTFPFRPELEDIHMNVERRLLELVGEVGGKLHTGRSRNDQIALDERLYLKEVAARTGEVLRAVQRALVARAAETVDTPMPGYTHMQRAQPIVLAHHLLAYVFMLQRDRERFAAGAARADVLPLGAAALAGAAFPIDREALARDLGFAAVTLNSLDAVSDRDYVLEYLAAAAITGMHLSRLAADLALWATAEFGFVEFSDAFATGSSIMPQKKNPDVAELIRGKSGRLYGNLMAVLTADEGAAAGLQLGHAGGQGGVLRLGRHAGGDRRRSAAHAGLAHLPHRAHARRGRRELRDRDRPGRLPRAQGAAVPRGPRDRGQGRPLRARARRHPGAARPRRAAALLRPVRRRRPQALDRRGLPARPCRVGGTAPTPCGRRSLRLARLRVAQP